MSESAKKSPPPAVAVKPVPLSGEPTDFYEFTAIRRFVLVLVIFLCIGLPRAGFVMPGFNLPLPLSLVALHLIFWYVLLFRPVEPRFHDLIRPFFIFVGLVVVAFAIGFFRGASMKIMIVETATFLGQIPAFFVVAWLVKDENDARLALRWLLYSILFASAYGIVQFYYGEDVIVPGLTYTAGSETSLRNIRSGAQSRILSSYGDPNVFAGALVLFLPAVIGLFMTRGRLERKPWFYITTVAALVLGLVALAYCNSRAGYLGVLIAGSLVIWRYRPRFLKVVLPLLLGLWVLSETGLSERIVTRMDIPKDDPRWIFPGLVWAFITTHPEGAGLGIYASVTYTVGPDVRLSPATTVWSSYNSYYLHLLARTGILGTTAFLWMCYRLLRPSWRHIKNRTGPARMKPVVAGFLAGFAGVQLAMMFNPFYQMPGGGINVWLALGLAYAISWIERDESTPVPKERNG